MMCTAVRLWVPVILVGANALAQDLIWSYQATGGYVDTSPAIGDLDEDGVSDIVVATTGGNVVALDISGRVIWEQTIPGPITIPPTIATSASREAVVLAMNNVGTVAAFGAADGRPLWRTDLPDRIEWGQTTLATADLDGDDIPEIVSGDRSGHVVGLDLLGDLRWIYQGNHGWTSPPAVADLDGDHIPEILLAGTDIPLVCLTNDGKERWRIAEATTGASPVVADLNSDGTPEIICGIGASLAMVDYTGKPVWRIEMSRPIDSAITVADPDGDGNAHAYAVDLAGAMVCADYAGNELWRADVEERARRSPSVGDIDGDGTIEILVAGYSGRIHVFTPDGALETEVPLDAVTNSTATLVHARDGKVAVVVPVVAGSVNVFQWPNATADSHVLWPEYRANAQRTGSLISAGPPAVALDTTVDFGNVYVGMNEITIHVSNPSRLQLHVQIEAKTGLAEPSMAFMDSEETEFELRLPYVIPSDRAVNISLESTVTHEDRTVARREHHAYVVPYQKELADARARLSSAERILPRLTDTRMVDAQLFHLAGQRAAFEARVDASGAADDLARRELRDDLHTWLDELTTLATCLESATMIVQTHGVPVAVSAANPWAPFGGMDEIEENRLAEPSVAVQAFHGETESAAFNVFNFTGEAKTFRVLAEPLTCEAAGDSVSAIEALQLRETVDVPTDVLDLSADALPALNQGSLLQVPAWGARQIWITVDSSALSPGHWQGHVHLKSLDVEPIEAAADLAIDVWPHALPEKQALSLCHWGYVHRSVLQDQPEAALADQVEHGTDVFVGLFYPEATYDESGDIIGDIDFAAHDDYVRRHAPHGTILFFNYQGALKGPGGQESDAYAKAHVQWLRQWVAHLKELGVGYDGFALYPIDEPGLSDGLVDRYLHLAKLAREADPKIQLYTDPVGRITIEELEAMAPYVDIWCPNRNGFLLERGNNMLDFIKSTGKTVWTYECEGNAKHQSPLGYYRGLAWLSWHHGLTGFGFWSYCTSQFDPWFRPREQFDYLLIYQGDGVVPSKRWEAVRDGIEDYTMLAELRRVADEAEAAGNYPDAVARARELLGQRATAIARFCGLDDEGTLPGHGGASATRKTADERWEALQRFRHDLAATLSALTGNH